MRKRLYLLGATGLEGTAGPHRVDLRIDRGEVSLVGVNLPPEEGSVVLDLAGLTLLPGLANAHDHLDLSTFPPLGRPPYPNAYEWGRDVETRDQAEAAMALAVDLPDRLFLGGLRNLLCGVTATVHAGLFHRSLGRDDFPIRVQERYDFAHSPGLTPQLRKAYRTTDRRIPFLVHAAEGTDEGSFGELELLKAANVLRQNTVIAHAIAVSPEGIARLAEAKACVAWCPEAGLRLYGRSADVVALRAAGVRVGLGSESPMAGPRDALSNLAVAQQAWGASDAELVELATRASAEVARLPVGRFEAGAPADFVAVRSLPDFLSGQRGAVALVVVRGQPLYGEPELVHAAGVPSAPLTVDGERRRLESSLHRRLVGASKQSRSLSRVPWISGLRIDEALSASPGREAR